MSFLLFILAVVVGFCLGATAMMWDCDRRGHNRPVCTCLNDPHR
jgi:hypothetical protein